MKKWKRAYSALFVGLGVLFLIAIWAIIAAILKGQGNMVIVYPHEAFTRSFELLFLKEAGKTWRAILWTLLRLLIGFVISFVLAAVLGSLGGLFESVRSFMKSIIGVMRTIPTAAVVILIVATIYGPKYSHLITYVPCFLVFLVAFPLLYESFKNGLLNENEYILYSLDLDGGRRSFKALMKVLLPDIMPYVWLAIAQSLGLSLKVCIMSEVLSATSASKPSVGGLIINAQNSGAIEDILPYALIALLLMLVIDVPIFFLKGKENRK